jgi:hypothetical protein
LTGQSNALGIGGCYDHTNNDDQPDRRIWGYVSNNDYWTVFDLRIQIGSKKPNNQCLAFQYAKQLLKKNPLWNIGIIICGLCSQSITRWIIPYTCNCRHNHLQQSKCGKIDKGDIYDWCTLMVNNALVHIGKHTFVNTIIWYQGETDYLEDYAWYFERLCKVIKQFESEKFCKNTNFICAELFENNITNAMNYVFSLEYNWKFLRLIQNSFDGCHFTKFNLISNI